MKTLQKAYDTFFDIIKYVSVVILFCMVAIIGYCVFMRYVINNTPKWGDEMALLCMVWFCLLSASWAYKENRHIRIGFWENILPPRAYWVVEVIVHILALVMFCVLTHYAITMFVLVGKTRMAGSGLPLKVLYLAEPVSMFCMIIAGIGRGVEVIGRK